MATLVSRIFCREMGKRYGIRSSIKTLALHDFDHGLTLKFQNQQIQADFGLNFAKIAEFLARGPK